MRWIIKALAAIGACGVLYLIGRVVLEVYGVLALAYHCKGHCNFTGILGG